MADEPITARTSELQMIVDTLQRLEASDVGGAFLEIAVQATMELASADHAALAVRHADGGMRYARSVGFPPEIASVLLHSLSPGAEEVLRVGEALFIEDYQTDPFAQPLLRRHGVASVLHLPIRVGGTLVGVLSFGWQSVTPRPEGQRAVILAGVAEQVGVALERQGLLERLKSLEARSERLENFHTALLAANEVLVQRRRAESLFQEICTILVRHTGLRLAWIGLRDEGCVRPLTHAGEAGAYADLLAAKPFEESWFGPVPDCLRNGRPVVWQDETAPAAHVVFARNAADYGLGSATACLPLRTEGKLAGLLAVYASEPGYFAEDLMLLLRRLADGIGFALLDLEETERARFLSRHDPLTNLPNEVYLRETIEERVAAARTRGDALVVAHVVVADFMEANDALGYVKGDAVLREVAARLLGVVGVDDLVVRVGGAEFTLLVAGLEDEEAAVAFGRSTAAVLEAPFHLGDERLELRVNVGIALDRLDGGSAPEQVLRHAHMAIFRAASAGPGAVVCFSPEIEREIVSRQTLREQIAAGLTRREFCLHYQPQVEMQTGSLVGVEALVRWRHPARGMLEPRDFLPAIEEHALLVQLGDYVLDSALSQMERWRAVGVHTRVSVNVAAIQLRDPDFAEGVSKALSSHPAVDPRDLTLEMVESAAIDDTERTIAAMQETRRLGVRWALDDFGTGYSSLTHLQRLPVDEVKMDQSFTQAALADMTSLSIMNGLAAAILPMRRVLVAEGVDDVSQGPALLDLGCSIGQGYIIARPMPPEELPAWISTWRPDPAWQRTRVNLRRWDHLLLLAGWQEEEAHLVQVALGTLQSEAPPTSLPDVDRCRLGLWCNGPGRETFSSLPLFQEIDGLHQQLHGTIYEMLRRKAAGDEVGATLESFELTQWSADLIARIEELYAAVMQTS